MEVLKENDTFEEVLMPDNKLIIGGRWVYIFKDDPIKGEECRSRYVAKGFSQKKGVDYQHEHLLNDHFCQSYADPCLYTKFENGNVILLLIWVENLVIAANNNDALNSVKENLIPKTV